MSNFSNSRLDERYRNDAVFNKVVDMMYSTIASHGITPSELREAIFLAHYRYEMENPSALKSQIMLRMSEIYGEKK